MRRFIFLCAVAYASGSLSFADEIPAEAPSEEKTPAPLTLRMCREIALGNQPAIAAAQATLTAAVDRANALEHLRGLASLSRELPVRKQQACLGIVIARGGLAQAEAETMYGVTFSYLSAIYARQQMDYADQIGENLDALRKLVDDALLPAKKDQKGKRDSAVALGEHRNVVEAYKATLEGRRQQAQQGEPRALAALREAMGVGCEYPLPPLPRVLPCPKLELNKEELIALALARRGEIVQTANAVEVANLEIAAQGRTHRSLSRTFAAGSDIHARPVPTGIYDGRTYRPGALALEMPTTLVGTRCDRQTQSRDYWQRAQAVDAKTRQLIALTVEDAYLLWREKSAEVEKLEKAYQEHSKFSSKLLNDPGRGINYPISVDKQNQGKPTPLPVPPYPNMDDVLHANVLTTRLFLEWKDAHYQALLALAALEHATGGGFAVDFDAAPACPPDDPPIRKPVLQP
jgi:outer membrane protein TolC